MTDHWRLVLSNGVVVDVRVRECGFVDGGSDSDPWVADCYWCTGFRRPSLLTAVSSLADDIVLECEMAGLDVHVAEIVAPGQLTRLEWKRRFATECSEMIRKARVEERTSCACQEAGAA